MAYGETRSGAAGWIVGILLVVVLVVAAFAFGLINIDQLSSGSAPKVAVTGGEMPKFDVSTAKVDVGTKTETVEVPTVKVDTKAAEVKVPTVSVTPAGNPDAKN